MSSFMQNWLLRRAMCGPRGGGGDGIEIPTVYQRVEYLQGNDSAYINTGVNVFNSATKLRWEGLIGYANGSSGRRALAAIQEPNGGAYCEINANSKLALARFIIDHVLASDTLYQASMELVANTSNTITLTDGGSNYSTLVNVAQSGNLNGDLELFKYYVAVTGSGQRIGDSKVYVDDVLTRHFIPCYRKSDHKPGLWDMVGWKFYVNEGSGADFTVGPDVIQPATQYIVFEDRAVEAICVQNFSSDGIGLTMQDAAAVTSLGDAFRDTSIVSFDELQYFGVSDLRNAFWNCSSLQSVIVGSDLTSDTYGVFAKCVSLKYVEFKGRVDRLSDGCLSYGITNCTIVFRSTSAPNYVQNTAMWSTTGSIVYVPYSADHSVLSAYQNAFSALANYSAAIAGIYELNPDGTIPS